MKGDTMVRKLAMAAKYGVFPASMIAAFVYSPPDYVKPKRSITSSN
ncbi:hypothetical protein RND81_01G109500 [Saponaria officinalis]|uniref:Uncharacterized protein n=1 Tax=Saponaria officinalis TaxID=3572 RepID=A0AAW1N6Z3_SAPOF